MVQASGIVRAALFGAVLLVVVPPARAASFDCAKAASPLERQICSDPAISDADTALGTTFDKALATSPTPFDVRDAQRQWVRNTRNTAKGPGALLAAYQSRIDELRKQIEANASVRQRVASGPLGACLPLSDTDNLVCALSAHGTLADAPGGPLRWQMQNYKDGERDAGSAVIVIAGEGADARVVTWGGGDGVLMEPPKLVRVAQGGAPHGVLLQVPGMMDGTGHFSAEMLYAFHDDAWHAVDINTWQAQMSARLPKGKEVWKGVFPDWTKMTADTALWKPSDGNCCPSAGSARATLRLDGDRIVLVSLSVSSKPVQ